MGAAAFVGLAKPDRRNDIYVFLCGCVHDNTTTGNSTLKCERGTHRVEDTPMGLTSRSGTGSHGG